MVKTAPHEAFAYRCAKGDVVLRQSYKPESYGKLYYACPKSKCSNCKHLRGKISVLKATMEMHMHPEQHTVNSAALFHEVLNEMEKLDLE
ncbi:hypothetical protein Tco_1260954 [Tanacetum coccineum]